MRGLLASCIVALLALGCWWWLARDDARPAPRAGGAADATTTQQPAVQAASSTIATELARTIAPEAAAHGAPPVPAGAIWIDVRIVDKVTQQPVPGADASWIDAALERTIGELPWREREAAYRDREAFAAHNGWRGRADHDGILRVNLGQGTTSVFAGAGSRRGIGVFARDATVPAGGHRIELEDGHTLRVRVLDHAKRPAGAVPVKLDFGDPDVGIGGSGTPAGDDGSVAFRVPARPTYAFGTRQGQPVTRWAVRVMIPGLAVEPLLLDAQQPPPTAPIELQLPPTGALHLRVLFDGAPCACIESVRIDVDPGDDEPAWARPVVADGHARFPYVPLGRSFFVSDGDAYEPLHRVVGPTMAGEETVATVDLASGIVALAGRLLRADGSVLANQTVRGTYSGDPSLGHLAVRTDGSGRFVLLLGPPRPNAKRSPTLRSLTFEHTPADGPSQRVVVPPRDLGVGKNDLGELRFEATPLVVSGRFVFDTPGSARADFHVERCVEQRTGNEVAEFWTRAGNVRETVADDGAFAVHGSVPDGRYRLCVGGFLPCEPVEFVRGATGVEVRVRRGHELTASCRLPDGLEPRHVQLWLVPPGGAPGDDEPGAFVFSKNALLARAGAESAGGVTQYGWRALPAGIYALHVTAPGFAEPFVAVHGVAVPQPEGGDPRLQDLDLRPVIGVLRIRVRVPAGSKAFANAGTVAFVLPQPADTWLGFTLAADDNLLPVRPGPLDLLIARDGCRPLTLRGVTGVVDVTLEPWPLAELQFTGIGELPDGVTLRAAVRADRRVPRPDRMYRADRGAGDLDVLLQPPGGGARISDGGAVKLPFGDGVDTIEVRLEITGVRIQGQLTNLFQDLTKVAPSRITAPGPMTVELSADEIRAVVGKLRQAESK